MFWLITGGSGSGKSEYAEQAAADMGQLPLYYIATMRVWDEEGEARVRKHRLQREGKGFCTLERFTDLKSLELPEEGGTVLLECLSNLTANEFYDRTGMDFSSSPGKTDAAAAEKETEEEILQGIYHILSRCRNLIAVTNEVFSDGIQYPEETEMYIRILGNVNRRLAARADRVTEVVCGIPVPVKPAEEPS